MFKVYKEDAFYGSEFVNSDCWTSTYFNLTIDYQLMAHYASHKIASKLARCLYYKLFTKMSTLKVLLFYSMYINYRH